MSCCTRHLCTGSWKRPGFLCADPHFTDRFIQKLSSARMGQDEFLSIGCKGSSWCLLQEATSAFVQLHHPCMIPDPAPPPLPTPSHTAHLGTTVLLGSFWNGESPWDQPTSGVLFTPCCGLVFQQLWRLCLLPRVYDTTNNKQRTGEMTGFMKYMWKFPGICPLKTVCILCRESARHLFPDSLLWKALLLLTWWVA